MSVVLYCLENYWLIASIVFVATLTLTKFLGVPASEERIKYKEDYFKANGRPDELLLKIAMCLSVATSSVLWPVFFPKYVYKTIRYGFTKI